MTFIHTVNSDRPDLGFSLGNNVRGQPQLVAHGSNECDSKGLEGEYGCERERVHVCVHASSGYTHTSAA